jgi:hypothetical protein
MGARVFCLLLATGLLVGCKKQETSTSPMENQSGDPAAPASPRGPAPGTESVTNATVIADTGDVNATLQQLTRELRDYVVRTRTVPRSFDDFAVKSQLQFPPPPTGKKYAIDKQAVVLVKK